MSSFLYVHYKKSRRNLPHVAYAGEVFLKAGKLFLQLQSFLLGQRLEKPFLPAVIKLDHVVDPASDGLEVGQRSTQPALIYVGHAAASRLGRDGFLGLLLGAYKENVASLGDYPRNLFTGFSQKR